MYLKSLDLRGFKSFADTTKLEFEPGITVIVGPNGSGKSNIVDALTWSMGTRRAKDLRGGQMADVIFAGSKGRRALGRASVEITIDNADDALPIEFAEVTVGRAMFASGENSYSINDVECRQLDVAELLSDTGLGRESHTIVGQGRIDAVLNARPEDRRAFIEEAAGILKHRRRKERALRKLKQMDGHLERLVDVLREMSRQLKPLERQAEAARRHADLVIRLDAVRAELALREYLQLTRRWNAEEAARASVTERITALTATLEQIRIEESAASSELRRLTPSVRTATEVQFALANTAERASGVVERVIERRNGLAEAVDEPIAGRPPEDLRDEADRVATKLGETQQKVAETTAAFEAAQAETRVAEQARRAHEQAAAAETRRRVEARERRIRWEGEVSQLRSSLAHLSAEEGRLASQLQAQDDREAELTAEVEAAQRDIHRLDADSPGLQERVQVLEKRRDSATASLREKADSERELERIKASLEARADALYQSSTDLGAAGPILDDAEIDGVIGSVASFVRVADGYAKAVSTALGPLADALVVQSRSVAEEALGFVHRIDAGAVLVVAANATVIPDEGPSLDSIGAKRISTVMAVDSTALPKEVAAGLDSALKRALAGVYVCADLEAACRLADTRPELIFVTPKGIQTGARGHTAGATGHSALLSRAAADEATAQAERVISDLSVATRKVADAERDVADVKTELDAAQAVLSESDTLITAAADRLARTQKELARCRSERGRIASQATQVEDRISGVRTQIDELESREVRDVPEPEDAAAGDLQAEALDDELRDAREAEVQARLDASSVKQEAAELERRRTTLLNEADQVEARLAAREARRLARLDAMARCDQLERIARRALTAAETSREEAAVERDTLEEQRAEHQRELGVIRSRITGVDDELRAIQESRHQDDLAHQELRQQRDAVIERLGELSIDDPDEVLKRRGVDATSITLDFGVEKPGNGDAPDNGEENTSGVAETDDDLSKTRMVRESSSPEAGMSPEPDVDQNDPVAVARAAVATWDVSNLRDEEETLVRQVGLLGTVNPLALEEFTSLKERHAFMSAQLDDLRESKNDLLKVVDAVDGRIEEIFEAAFNDIAGHFETIFPKLFPGGTGKLILTDPDNMLTTGVEVEARPPGKKVKRLSLLSGGERSLTALAVLFSIFAARPSPFYVLDEVEAALDDANLGRFLAMLEEFRGFSQWIIVTHQRRTMEIADTIYGVSMASNGVSKVVSLRQDEANLSA